MIRLPALALAVALLALPRWAGAGVLDAPPHPAVARIIVQEAGGTAYGSGSLVDAREQYGLVVTNWHVVRDATGTIEVVFPSGFRSEARALKLDHTWDLAALVVWRPPVEPVVIAAAPPRPGDRLTICGYGKGDYRAATGRCTEYYAPRVGMPQELVELDVQARQGDSGGPIFNDRGELAGVLFGAGQGTTLGSFQGRVGSFLASLAPDIGAPATRLAEAPAPRDVPPQGATPPADALVAVGPAAQPADSEAGPQRLPPAPEVDVSAQAAPPGAPLGGGPEADPWPEWRAGEGDWPTGAPLASVPGPEVPAPLAAGPPLGPGAPPWFETAKSVLAVVGAVAVFLQVVRAVS